MANYSTDTDLLEYEPGILTYGIQDFSDLHTKTTQDIQRHLRIHWWPRATFNRYDVSAGTYSEMDHNLLTDSQLKRAAVYHVLGYYIYPRLSTFSPEGDVFREKMQYYREEFNTEITNVMEDGVEYDFDSSGTVSTGEKQPTHFNRLVR